MSNVVRQNFNTANLERLFKSNYISVWSRNLLMKSCDDPEEYAKGLAKFIGIRLMNDITAVCFVVATYVAASLAVKQRLDDGNGTIQKALNAADTQKTADLFDTLINPPKNRKERQKAKQVIEDQKQNGFQVVFIALLTVFGGKSQSDAENIYRKFKIKLGRITPWIVRGRASDIKNAIKPIFVSNVVPKVVDDESDEDTSDRSESGTSTASDPSSDEISDDEEEEETVEESDSDGDDDEIDEEEEEEKEEKEDSSGAEDDDDDEKSEESGDESDFDGDDKGSSTMKKDDDEGTLTPPGTADLGDDNDNDNDNHGAGSTTAATHEGDALSSGSDDSEGKEGDEPPEVRRDLSTRKYTPLKDWKTRKIKLDSSTKWIRFDLDWENRYLGQAPKIGDLFDGGYVVGVATSEEFKTQLKKVIMRELYMNVNEEAEFTEENIQTALDKVKVEAYYGHGHFTNASAKNLFILPDKYKFQTCKFKRLKDKTKYKNCGELVGVLFGKDGGENTVLLLPPSMDGADLDEALKKDTKDFDLKGKKLISNIVSISKDKEFTEIYDEDLNRISFFYKNIDRYKKYSAIYSQIKPTELKSEDLEEESFDYSVESDKTGVLSDFNAKPLSSDDSLWVGNWGLWGKTGAYVNGSVVADVYTLKCLHEFFENQSAPPLLYYKIIAGKENSVDKSKWDILVVPTVWSFVNDDRLSKEEFDNTSKIFLTAWTEKHGLDNNVATISRGKIGFGANTSLTVTMPDYLRDLKYASFWDKHLKFEINGAIYRLPQHLLKIRKLVDQYFGGFKTCTIIDRSKLSVEIEDGNLKIGVPSDCTNSPKLLVNVLKQVAGCIEGQKVNPVKLMELQLKVDEYHGKREENEASAKKTDDATVDKIIATIKADKTFKWEHDWSKFVVNCDLDNVVTIGVGKYETNRFLGYANVNVDHTKYIVIFGAPKDKTCDQLYKGDVVDTELYDAIMGCVYYETFEEPINTQTLQRLGENDRSKTFSKWLENHNDVKDVELFSSYEDYKQDKPTKIGL